MHIAILGRQPALGVAELEQLYGSDAVRWFTDQSATIDSSRFDFNRLGGSQKAGRVVTELSGNWRSVSMRIVKEYSATWAEYSGKITLGISAYGFPVSARDVQKTGLVLKAKLKQRGVSVRLVPNVEPALNSATSHHNKLGLSSNHVELLIVRASGGKVIVAESVGAQNITAIAARDQARPKTDSFVGMLPPKLARIMVNLTNFDAGSSNFESRTMLDPFCGTGVLLQEAMLLGYNVQGTDLSPKMIDYSQVNLEWLISKFQIRNSKFHLTQGDAMEHVWAQPVDAVATETYLGQPFSAPPSPAKLTEVRGNCNHIISEFLKNIATQLQPGTPLCVAVPAWRDIHGNFSHLPLIGGLKKLGFTEITLQHVTPNQLLYYRENQVVARELLLLRKT